MVRVGILSILWDFTGCALAVHKHAPPFAVAFLGLALSSAVITARSMVESASARCEWERMRSRAGVRLN
jgi:hypothetical protein